MFLSAQLRPFQESTVPRNEAVHVEVDHEGRSTIHVRFRLIGFADRLIFPALDASLLEVRDREQRDFTVNTLMQRMGLSLGELPAPAVVGRADELWRHTCVEVFGRLPSGGYVEFNLAPSGRWAAYGFDAYRTGMSDLDGNVRIETSRRVGDDFELSASLFWSGWPQVREIGLSAVLETTDEEHAYWALAHPSTQPDFHHPDSFTLRF
jgi:hypothetical protein